MKDELIQMSFAVELKPGEKLSLPPALVESVGAGRWILSIRPAGQFVGRHDAFLNGYILEDEGLYEDREEMEQFLRESREDMLAGRTEPAVAALERLAKKYRLKKKGK